MIGKWLEHDTFQHDILGKIVINSTQEISKDNST